MLDATPLFRLYARYRWRQLRRQDPREAQRRQLRKLIAKAEATRFGRDHRFGEIRTVEDFQARVPLRRYEDFWSSYWQGAFPHLEDCTWPGVIPFFAVTSGTTTGRTKYIPCSHEMVRANEWAGADILVHHLLNRRRSHILAGKSFVLSGSTDLVEEAPGIRSGDLSGIASSQVPWWARSRYFPPDHLALIEDWEKKVETLAPLSLRQDIRMLAGTPSWLLIFIEKMAANGGGERLVDFWPELELIVHGAINFAPYRSRFHALLKGGHAETREVYAASEGFIALADRDDGEGMRLTLDNGLFYEFVPLDELHSPNPTRLVVDEVETDVNYALVLSSCAGLWGYVVGDTVKFVSLDPPRVLITGRTSYMLSAFGEHLIDAEIEEAVAGAAETIGTTVSDYSVAPIFPENTGDLGRHLYVVEFAEPIADDGRLARFVETLDARLSTMNDDYKAHRSGGFGLDAPRVHAVAPGTFAAWMKSRGQLGGQHKVPRIINDPDLFQQLRDFVGAG